MAVKGECKRGDIVIMKSPISGRLIARVVQHTIDYLLQNGEVIDYLLLENGPNGITSKNISTVIKANGIPLNNERLIKLLNTQ